MKKLLVNACRLVLALTFILSGFVKAVDPHGTQYKIEDYLGAMGLAEAPPEWVTLMLSVGLSAVEFCLGMFLLFAIRRRVTSKLVLAMMAVMTPLTLWLALANPISDCGCFGDALVLTNWQTFWKNVVLLAMAIVVACHPMEMFRFVSRSNQWIVINYSALFILAVSAWSLYDLPQFDFRPYHVGANIRQGMEIPEGAPTPQYRNTYIYEKDGVRREFVDEFPDSTWTFVDRLEPMLISEGYVPPIHDFSLTLQEQDGDEVMPIDITDEVLADSSYTFLLVAPFLEKADDSRFDLINELYEYSREHGYRFYCLTASLADGQERWRDMTGAEYPFCQTDPITLKTIVRSNPGLVLLKDAVVVGKWSHNRLPEIEPEQEGLPLQQLPMGQMATTSVPTRVVWLLLWFVLPLALLTIADRTWAWTKWLRRHKTTRSQEPPSTTKESNNPLNSQKS